MQGKGILLKPDKDGMIDFIPPYFLDLTTFFKNELGIMVKPGATPHPITQELQAYYIDFVGRNEDLAEIRQKWLIGVADNLATIKIKANKDQYRKFCKKIANSRNYVGSRFEICVYSALLKMDIKVESRESPDFFIGQEPKLGIECTSLSLGKDITSKEQIGQKLEYMLFGSARKKKDAKNNKEYALNSCALFVDWTHLFQIVMGKSNQDFQKYLDDLMKDMCRRMKYGSLVLFTYAYKKNTSEFQILHGRHDAPHIDPRLEEFLDKLVPRRRFVVSTKDTIFPQYG